MGNKNGQRFFQIGRNQSCDYSAAGGEINCYKFSGEKFDNMFIEPVIPFAEIYNEEVIGQE